MDHRSATTQLPLEYGVVEAPASKLQQITLLRLLDARGIDEVKARANVDLRGGGGFGRPIPYLCDDDEVYWTKRRSQNGLASELIADRLAHMLGVGMASAVVRIDAFLYRGGEAVRAAGTKHLDRVVSSKDVRQINLHTASRNAIDSVSRAQVAVFQSWIDVVDQQALIRVPDGRVFSHDHGDSFRLLAGGPPRIVVASLEGVPWDWASAVGAAFEMVSRIEQLSPADIIAAVAGVPDDDGWQGSFARRLAIARWLLKRQGLLRKEVEKWLRSVS